MLFVFLMLANSFHQEWQNTDLSPIHNKLVLSVAQLFGEICQATVTPDPVYVWLSTTTKYNFIYKPFSRLCATIFAFKYRKLSIIRPNHKT